MMLRNWAREMGASVKAPSRVVEKFDSMMRKE